MKNFADILYIKKFVKFLKRGRFYLLVLGVIDLLALSAAFELTYLILNLNNSEHLFYKDEVFLRFFMIMSPIWFFILLATNNSQIPRTRRYSRLFFEFTKFSLFNLIFLEIVALLYDRTIFNLTFILVCAVSDLLVLFAIRLVEYKFLKLYRSTGHNNINIIIVADAESGELVDKLIKNKEWGYRTLYVISNSKRLRARYNGRVRFISEKGIHSLKTMLEYGLVDEVIYVKENIDHAIINNLLKWCEEVGVVFRYPYQLSKLTLANGRISYIYDKPFITFSNVPSNSIGLGIKNFMDYCVSFFSLVMLFPVFLILGILIKLDSKGPVFFKQARVGLRGRQFYLYKFRTMIVNAEELRKAMDVQNEMDGPVFKIKNDPRITKVGKFLRKTGLDELPQLINVLNGEMSLIGPRPPLMSEVRQYERWQLRRLSVKPGITCLWQIQPNRNDIKFENWMKLDLDYIDNWSLQSDIMLLVKTVKTVIWGTGA